MHEHPKNGRRVRGRDNHPEDVEKLRQAVIRDFVAEFAKGAELLHYGNNGKPSSNHAKLATLGIPRLAATGLPDVVLFDEQRHRLLLIQIATTGSPITAARLLELKTLCKHCALQLVFVTVCSNRTAFQNLLTEISWGTSVWIAEEPDHIIHFNGYRVNGRARTDN